MENSRRRVNPDELYRDIRREMDVNSFAAVVSAFRAHGELNDEKRAILKHLQTVFNISNERYGAEMRRVANDDFLDTIASRTSGSSDSSMSWSLEGRRLIPILPRVQRPSLVLTMADEIVRYHMMGALETTSLRPSNINNNDYNDSTARNEVIGQSRYQMLLSHLERSRYDNDSSMQANQLEALSSRLSQTATSASAAAATATSNSASSSSDSSSSSPSSAASSATNSSQFCGENENADNLPSRVNEQSVLDAAEERETRQRLESRMQHMDYDDDHHDDNEGRNSNTDSRLHDMEHRNPDSPGRESSPQAELEQSSESSDDHAMMSGNFDDSNDGTLVGVPSLPPSEVLENGLNDDSNDGLGSDNEERRTPSPAQSNDSTDDEHDSIRLYESNSNSSFTSTNSNSSDDEGGGAAIVNNHNHHNPGYHHNPGSHHNPGYRDNPGHNNPGLHHNPGRHRSPSSSNPEDYKAVTNNAQSSNSEESSSASANGSDSDQTVVNSNASRIEDSDQTVVNSNASRIEDTSKHEVEAKSISAIPSDSTPVPIQNQHVSQEQEVHTSSNSSSENSNSSQKSIESTSENDELLNLTETDSVPMPDTSKESPAADQDLTSSVDSSPGTSSAQAVNRSSEPAKTSIQDQNNLLKTAKVVSTGTGNNKHIIVVQKGGAQQAARTVALSSANKELLNKVLAGKNISPTNINCPVVSVQKAATMLKSCSNVSFRGNQGSVILLDVSREQASSMSIAEILQASGVLGEKKIVKIGTEDAVNSVKPNTKITQLSSAATVMLTNPVTSSSKENKPIDNLNKLPVAESRLHCNNINRLEQESCSISVSEGKASLDCENNEEKLVPPVSRTPVTQDKGVLPQIESNIEIICDNMVNSQNTNSITEPSSPERLAEFEGIFEEQEHDDILETKKSPPYENSNSKDTIPVTSDFEDEFLLDCDNSSFSEKRKHSESDETNVKLIKLVNESISSDQANDGVLCIPATSQFNSRLKDCDITDLNCSTLENESSGNIVISMECDSLTDSINSLPDQQITGAVYDPGVPDK